jgi:pimeloyl-ACP methyl ester carboxylesterase
MDQGTQLGSGGAVSASLSVTASDERPVFLPRGEGELFGVLTIPPTDPLGIAVIVLSGAGPDGATHRTGLWVRLCRELAGFGFHALRFDWHGIGDSTGPTDRFRLDRPFVDDLMAARDWLASSQGIDRIAVVGSCFGARTALAAAPSMDGLEALLLFAVPIRDSRFSESALAGLAEHWSLRRALHVARHPRMLTGLLDARRRRTIRRYMGQALRTRLSFAGGKDAEDLSWVSPHLLRHLESTVDAGIPTTLAYGVGDKYYRDLQKAMQGPLGRAIERGAIEVKTISPHAIHSWDRVEGQKAAEDALREWARAYRDLRSDLRASPP